MFLETDGLKKHILLNWDEDLIEGLVQEMKKSPINKSRENPRISPKE